MKTLADILSAPQHQDAFTADAVQLIESHIASRGGIKGITLKTGLAMLKAARPDILPRAVRRLQPEFSQALEPLYREFASAPQRDFTLFLQKNAQRAAAALLAAADARVAASSNSKTRSTYARFRSTAESEVLAAMPAIGKLIRAYLD
jgi:hypothetical protein